jgi:hypothetical protein
MVTIDNHNSEIPDASGKTSIAVEGRVRPGHMMSAANVTGIYAVIGGDVQGTEIFESTRSYKEATRLSFIKRQGDNKPLIYDYFRDDSYPEQFGGHGEVVITEATTDPKARYGNNLSSENIAGIERQFDGAIADATSGKPTRRPSGLAVK